MDIYPLFSLLVALAPGVLMLSAAGLCRGTDAPGRLWPRFLTMATLALCSAALGLVMCLAQAVPPTWPVVASWIEAGPLTALLAVLVQFLGTVIAAFSSRYLQGERAQPRYAFALGGVMAAVHLLLLANHWLLLIAAWTAVGLFLQGLLCFYPDRPFALLAAHKKRLADRLADLLLLSAAGLAWMEVGSGGLAELRLHLQAFGATEPLQWSAVLLVLAVILRTALLPVHGWLIQVMEAPTPVSALLHAGVVNLGGLVLIRFAPLLDAAAPARWLLVAFGLLTAVAAGLVMLTRISIKVRLAWSTVAQMGFMVLECGLGLYTLAALHLIGHSLYKAHSFLAASSVVRQTRLAKMAQTARVATLSLLLAPVIVGAWLALAQACFAAWPAWWSAILALAWAPLMWWPKGESVGQLASRWLAGLAMVAGLALLAWLGHHLPLGLHDQADPVSGGVALIGMGLFYLVLASLQWRPEGLETWRRWSYAGFYVDEFYTRLALRLWPTDWARASAPATPRLTSSPLSSST